MSLIGKEISKHRLDDFVFLSKVAEELNLNSQTIKRWLRDEKVDGVIWGRDRRKWIVIHKESVKLIKDHRDSIKIK